MKVAVIGGGAAGMMAAVICAQNGHETVLIEKNEKLGKKLFLTGKGRCNLTNACDKEELFRSVTHNPKFLYSAFSTFDNNDVYSFFEESRLRLKIERGNRVFPESDHSSDVIAALKRRLSDNGVVIRLSERVVEILVHQTEEGKYSFRITGIRTDKHGEESFDAVIAAIGGASYPTTGSDGSDLALFQPFDIQTESLMPSLVPFVTEEKFVSDLMGLSLKNVRLTMEVEGKKRFEDFGEMLFTHFGISGPLVLSASSYLNLEDYSRNIQVYIDLKPALDEKVLDERILRDFSEGSNKQIANVLPKLVPGKLASVILMLWNVAPDRVVHSITKEERTRLIDLLKAFPLTVSGNRGFNEAIITRGGINIKEINPKTMECKRIKGLFFAGEMIDTDALTGGFNLQIAWSTGYLAGSSIGGN